MKTEVIRIWYQTVSSKKNFPETLKSYQQDLGSFAGPGVEIEVHGLPEGGLADQYRIFERLDTHEFMRNLPKIRNGDYHAVAVGNSMDIGVWEAREVLDIPVLGHTETAIHFAAMMGRNFSLICKNDRWIYTYEEIVKRAGLQEKLVGISGLDFDHISDWDRLWYDKEARDQTIAEFKREAKKHIERGAEVIVPAAGCATQLFGKFGFFEIEGVPVLDGQRLLIRTAVMAARLRMEDRKSVV